MYRQNPVININIQVFSRLLHQKLSTSHCNRDRPCTNMAQSWTRFHYSQNLKHTSYYNIPHTKIQVLFHFETFLQHLDIESSHTTYILHNCVYVKITYYKLYWNWIFHFTSSKYVPFLNPFPFRTESAFIKFPQAKILKTFVIQYERATLDKIKGLGMAGGVVFFHCTEFKN